MAEIDIYNSNIKPLFLAFLAVCLEASRQDTEVKKRTPKQPGVTPRIQKTFTVDESTVLFMDRDYREAYTCHKNPQTGKNRTFVTLSATGTSVQYSLLTGP